MSSMCVGLLVHDCADLFQGVGLGIAVELGAQVSLSLFLAPGSQSLPCSIGFRAEVPPRLSFKSKKKDVKEIWIEKS